MYVQKLSVPLHGVWVEESRWNIRFGNTGTWGESIYSLPTYVAVLAVLTLSLLVLLLMMATTIC